MAFLIVNFPRNLPKFQHPLVGQLLIQFKMRKARATRKAKAAPKKRSASDFLAFLGNISVNEAIEEDSEEDQAEPTPRMEDDPSLDLNVELPELSMEGETISFDTWFNKNSLTKTEFAAKRPDFEPYVLGSVLALSTSSSIPGSIRERNAILKAPESDELKDPLAPVIFDYRDFFFAGEDYARFRRVAAIHALNHVYNDLDAKKNRQGDERDSGFTPCTVLVLCPYRHQALQFITAILECLPETLDGEAFEAEHCDRLKNEFSVEEVPRYLLRSKPKDWLEIFAGRTDTEFKMGLRFWDRKVSLFQTMAKSQIIVASPLALFLHKEKEAADFMSSVEVMIMDSVDAMAMQAWDRLVGFIDGLNARPSTVADCDWSRVRTYSLQANQKKMRQSIGYGRVITPEVHALFTGFENKRGGLIARPLVYSPRLMPCLGRSFRRVTAATCYEIGESMWKCFKERIFTHIKQWRSDPEEEAKRTVIYYASSMRFYQARKELELHDINFLELADEAVDSEEKRMKKSFKQDPNAVLLMTERFYYHHRTKLGAERVVFVQPPMFPEFASELTGTGEMTVYFTEFDEMAVERLAGSRVTGRILASDVYVL